MDSFGLGLILNFTDNATAGMIKASQAFNEMSGLADNMTTSVNSAIGAIQGLTTAGYGMNIVGDQMVGMGNAINDVFTTMLTKITQTGTEILGTRMTLQTLFKSAEEGEKAFDWAKQYATTSIFNFKDLLPAMTMMKAVGIDIRDTITTTSGVSQNLLDYAGDLAAVFPNMRNMYGTGIQGAMGALKEYISEGNAISLKRGAGLDIEEIIGEKKGGSIEERSRQVADLIEKIGALGMTANLAGTPMQRLSNLQDILFNSIVDISDKGVFEEYSKLIEKFYLYITSIPADEFSSMTQIIADALVSLMKPFEKLIDVGIKFIDWFRELVKEHPGLVKVIIASTALVGVFLVCLGTALKFAGSLFILSGAMLQVNLLAKEGITIWGLFRGALMTVLTKLIPFLLLAGAIYYAWKENLFGFRDLVTKVVTTVIDTITLMSDAWSDFSLSEENYQKAKDMGILPLIEAMLKFKFIAGEVWSGFKEGLQTFSDWVVRVSDKVQSFIDKISVMFNGVNGRKFPLPDVSKRLSTDTINNWKEFGKVLGIIGGLLATYKIATTIYGIGKAFVMMNVHLVKAVWGFLKFSGALAKNTAVLVKNIAVLLWHGAVLAFSTLKTIAQVVATKAITLAQIVWSGVTKLVAGAQMVLNAIMMMNPIGLVILAVVALIAIFVILWNKSEKFRNFFINMWGHIKEAVKNAGVYIKERVSNAVSKIKEIWSTVKGFITGAFDAVKSKVKGFFDWIQQKFGWLIELAGKIKKAFSSGAENAQKIHENGGGRYGAVVGAATGGFVKAQGLVALHPNELVVNDRLTQGLDSFLDDYNAPRPGVITSTQKETHSEVVRDTTRVIAPKTSPLRQETNKNDNRVIFEAGSVVLQASGRMTDAELESIAEKLMRIIARKQQLRAMAVRT